MRGLGERARWLSAVLIVVSITAVTAIVRVRPVKPTLHSEPLLASRPLLLTGAPMLAPRPLAPMPVVAVPAAAIPAPRPGVARVEVSPSPVLPAMDQQAVTEVAVAAAPRADVDPLPAAGEPALLASRALHVSGVPALRAPDVAIEESGGDKVPGHALVEMPVVVVSRAVVVAGRGIRSGVRATGALVKLAF